MCFLFLNHEGPWKSSHLLCSLNFEIVHRPFRQVHCPHVFSPDGDSFEFSAVTLIFIHCSFSPKLCVCLCVCVCVYARVHACEHACTVCAHVYIHAPGAGPRSEKRRKLMEALEHKSYEEQLKEHRGCFAWRKRGLGETLSLSLTTWKEVVARWGRSPLPSNKQWDERRWPQVAPGEV